MERWAKAQNKRNESGKVAGEMPVGAGGEVGAGSGAADAAFAVLLERRVPGAAPPPLLPEKSLTLKMHLKKDPQIPVSSPTQAFPTKVCCALDNKLVRLF